MVKQRSDRRYITGAEGLILIDAATRQARSDLDHAVQSVDERVKRRGELRREQAQAFLALAKFRLEHLKVTESADDLSHAETRATALLQEHTEFVAEEYRALQDMMAEIDQFEQEREDRAEALKTLVAQQEDKIEILLGALAQSPEYKALESAAEQAVAVTERATQKLELALADRREKGQPYEQDLLFSYLWARQYRTVNYEARGLIRLLDGWVARLCGYDKAHLTFARLTELPDRLAEHVAHVKTIEEDADAALRLIEASALKAGGVEAMEAEAEALRESLRALDTQIEAAETVHLVRSNAHTQAQQAETGPAEEARQILAEALRKMTFPDLRVLVAQTVESEDDEIVDKLVKLRAEEMQLDLEMTDHSLLPDRRSRDLERVEALRRGYKRASYASNRLMLDRSVLEDVLSDIRSTDLETDRALGRMRKTMKHNDGVDPRQEGTSRRRSGRPSRRYRRDDTGYGLEDVAVTVALELARAAIRSGGRSAGIDIDLGGFGRGPKGGGGGSGGKSEGYKTGGRF